MAVADQILFDQMSARQSEGMVQSAQNFAEGKGDFLSSFGNKFTGNLDWERSQLTNAFNASEAEKARQFNASEAEKARQFDKVEAQTARDWSERMSNTSYQRAVADMKAAGINPAALVGGFNGSSTPTASTAHGISASGAAARGTAAPSAGSGFGTLARIGSSLISLGISSAMGAAKIGAQREFSSALNEYTRRFGRRF